MIVNTRIHRSRSAVASSWLCSPVLGLADCDLGSLLADGAGLLDHLLAARLGGDLLTDLAGHVLAVLPGDGGADLLGDPAALAAGQVEAFLLCNQTALLLGEELAALNGGADLGGDVAADLVGLLNALVLVELADPLGASVALTLGHLQREENI